MERKEKIKNLSLVHQILIQNVNECCLCIFSKPYATEY